MTPEGYACRLGGGEHVADVIDLVDQSRHSAYWISWINKSSDKRCAEWIEGQSVETTVTVEEMKEITN